MFNTFINLPQNDKEMTEMIYPQEHMDLKLTCSMIIEGHSSKARYLFKLTQRPKGKRKWQEIRGYEKTYRVTTAMQDILKYLKGSQVMGLAELEYKKYQPTPDLINV